MSDAPLLKEPRRRSPGLSGSGAPAFAWRSLRIVASGSCHKFTCEQNIVVCLKEIFKKWLAYLRVKFPRAGEALEFLRPGIRAARILTTRLGRMSPTSDRCRKKGIDIK